MTATPFETTNQVTSLAAEATFVDGLVAANPSKVTKQVLGQSYNGHDLYALRFGGGTGRPLVIQTSVHSDENAPREAVFALVRDLCETAHPWSTLLSTRELVIVPTANPDGIPFDRVNGGGVNINRSFLNLDPLAPEAAILLGFYYDLDPVAILDGHEWPQHDTGTTFQVGTSTRVSTDDELVAECVAVGNVVKAAIEGAYTFDLAPAWYEMDTPAGALTDWTGQVGIVGTVTETMSTTATIGSGRASRVEQNELAQATWLDHVESNAARWETVSAAVRARAASKVARQDYTWTLDQQDRTLNGKPLPSTLWPSVSAVGYVIDAGEVATVGPVLDAHGIVRDGGTVSLDQERANIAATLLDPLSSTSGLEGDGSRITSATRILPDPVSAPVYAPQPPPNRDLDLLGSATW